MSDLLALFGSGPASSGRSRDRAGAVTVVGGTNL
jgi:hypothetical protein